MEACKFVHGVFEDLGIRVTIALALYDFSKLHIVSISRASKVIFAVFRLLRFRVIYDLTYSLATLSGPEGAVTSTFALLKVKVASPQAISLTGGAAAKDRLALTLR